MHRDLGHHDFNDSPQARTVNLWGSELYQNSYWVALPDFVETDQAAPEDVLGFATAVLPLKEDVTTVELWIGVRPDRQRQGIGRALHDVVTSALAEHGRTLWHTSAFDPGPEPTGEHAHAAASGAGAVDARRPAHRWLIEDGWTLEQCELPSMLTLGDHADLRRRVETLRAEAAASAGPDYEVHGWPERTPEQFVASLVDLKRRMSTDTPNAGMARGEQQWDADRLHTNETNRIARGRSWVTSVAVHVPSGEVVAYSEIMWPHDNPAGTWQEDTLVRDDHRGRRLGMLVKTANLGRLIETNPAAERVHTWNAAENSHMLAINDALGFVPVGREGAWQKRH